MKLVAHLFGVVLTSAAAFAQGTVQFDNYVVYFVTNHLVDAPFFDAQGIRLEGSNYRAQLYVWKTGTGFVPVGSPVAFGANGYFDGGTITIPFLVGAAWVQVRAWHVGGGPTFEEAAVSGSWTGVSNVLFLYTGFPGAPPSLPALLIGLEYPGSPVVVRSPAPQTVRWFDRATLSVIASSGVTMSYQWYQDPSDRPDGMIVGATNATYLTPSLRTNTTFWVAVANSKGSALSDRATITVVGNPPHLSIQVEHGLPALTLDGVVGQSFRLEFSSDIPASNWTVLKVITMTTDNEGFTDVQGTTGVARFYRTVAP